MKEIPVAHVRIQNINCIVFGADARDRSPQGRAELLDQLTVKARIAGLAVSKRALAFQAAGRTTFYGDRDLVAYLSRNAIALRWTHSLQA